VKIVIRIETAAANKLFLVLTTVTVSLAACRDKAGRSAAAERNSTPLMASFEDLKWTERKGMQFSVVSGDPRTGAFAQIRKVPAGTHKGLHAHSSELREVVISGVVYTGPDSVSARDFGPGSVLVMPANWVHVSGCRAGIDCVFYQEGKGKFDYHPVR
jgi:hypothetical protein